MAHAHFLRRNTKQIRDAAGLVPTPMNLEALEQRVCFAADPITTNHAVWFAAYGNPRVDGVVRPAEWAKATPIVRAQPNRSESAVTVRMLYNERGLFLSADVRDQYIWADGNGGGSGDWWEYANDDSLALYFDPTNTRKRFLPTAGRFLGFNTGKLLGLESGPGVVKRSSYLMGDAAGFGTPAMPDARLYPGTKWMTKFVGTPNNNSDVDVGWATEIFLPWGALNMAGMPANGASITMNFQVFFDDTGGVRDWRTWDQNSADLEARFGPRTLDDQISGTDSSFTVSNPGWQGPINYAWLTFSDQRVLDASPRQVATLSVTDVSGYGARLRFNAPRPSSVLAPFRGGVAGYEIRTSLSPIDGEDAWNTAAVVQNNFVPKAAGKAENLRIGGLNPGTPYYVAIRAVDAAGRRGAITTAFFTTQTTDVDDTGGDRVIVAPGGGTLQTESGTPFIINGSHAVMTNLYVRNLFPGDMWNAAGNYVNFVTNPGGEGTAAGFFQSLASYGVNTLRVPLEWIALPDAGRAELPRGMAWMEYPAGNFNPDMRTYLWNMMDEAAAAGLKLILHPFSTFNYKTYFELTPFAAQNGGPLTDINNFYQTPAVLTMAINRVKVIMDWINQHEHQETILGIELINEWDDWTWTLSASGNGDPSRTLEMRQRSSFMTKLGAAVKAYDPDVNILSSSIGLIPRGPTARALFVSDAFDVLAPHFYTASTSEPINSSAADKSIRPVSDWGALANYWTTSRRDNRPINNGEWGLVRWHWTGGKVYYTGYSAGADPTKPWTVSMDTDMYRTTTWTSIAAGFAGGGLRLGSTEMRDLIPDGLNPGDHGYLPIPLPESMRRIQTSVATFFEDTRTQLDWAGMDSTTLAGRVRFGNTQGHALISVGSTTGDQGLLYILQDANRSSGTVTGATATIDGLQLGTTNYTFEVWSTGASADVIATLTGIVPVAGKATFTLPDFDRDVMIKFKAAA